jgi:hypothetical protein
LSRANTPLFNSPPESTVFPTPLAASSRLQYFPSFMWYSKYSCLFLWAYWRFSSYVFQIFFSSHLWSRLLPICSVISCSTFNVSLYTNFWFYFLFWFLLRHIPFQWYCHIY